MSEIVLGIRLTADGKELVGTVRLSADEIKKMGDETKKSSSEAEKLNNQQKNLGQTLNVTASSIGLYSAAWNQAADLIVRAAGAVKDYIKDAALLNARHETMGVVLGVVGRNAGYSRGEMDLYAESVRKSGITMIAARESVTKMVQANLNLADASKLARAAQGAAVIADIDSSQAFERLIHGIQSGQTEILRTMGINVSFENSYKLLAKQLKVNVDQLTEQEKTQARANVVLTETTQILGVYEAAMGTAGKQLTSLVRYEQDLKTLFGEVFNEALVVAVMAYTGALKDANEETRQLAEKGKLKEWGTEVTDTLAFVADAAVSAAATFRLVGVGIAEMVALGNLTPLEAWRGGWKAITDAADEQRAEITRSTTMFRDALAERRKVLKEDAAQRALLDQEDALEIALGRIHFGKDYKPGARGPAKRPGGKGTEGADMLDFVRQLREQVEVTKQSSLEEKVLFEMREKHWKNATPQLKEQAVEYARQLDLRKQEEQILAANLKYYEYLADERDRQNNAVNQFNTSNVVTLQQLELETKLTGKSREEQELLTGLSKLESEYRKTSVGLADRAKDSAKQLYDQQKLDLEEAIRNKGAKQKLQDVAEEGKRQQVEMWQSVERTAHDTFISIFDSGKSAFDRLRDTLKNGLYDLLYQMTVKKWIIQIVGTSGGAGVAQSALGSSGGGDGGMLGMAQNAYSLFGGAGAGGAGAATYGAAGAGGAAASGMMATAGSGMATAGGAAAAGGAATGAAAAIPYVGWAIAAYMAYRSLTDDGGGPASFTGIDVNANLSKGGFAGQLFGTSKNSNTSFSWPTFMPGNFQEAANAAVTAAFTQVSKLGQIMGLDTSGLSGVTANVSFRSASHDAAVITRDLVNNLGALTDQMALKLMPNIKDFAQANETLTQTLVRLAQAKQQADVTNIFGLLDAALKLADQTRDLWLSDLSPLTNAQRLAQASGLYGQQLAAAQGGDLAALGSLSGTSRSYLQEARGYYASSQSYTDIFNQVQGQIGGLVEATLTEQSVQFASMGLTLADINVSIQDLDKRISDAFDKAIAAWQGTQTAIDAAAQKIVQSTQQTTSAVASSAQETALVMESAGSARRGRARDLNPDSSQG